MANNQQFQEGQEKFNQQKKLYYQRIRQAQQGVHKIHILEKNHQKLITDMTGLKSLKHIGELLNIMGEELKD